MHADSTVSDKTGQRRPGRQDVAEELRRRIVAGELRPGDLLPTQEQLGDEFGATRGAVRGALELLEEERLILRGRQGSPRTVAPRDAADAAGVPDEGLRLYSPKPAVSELTDQVREAFLADRVTIDAYCLDSEMLHHAVTSAVAGLSRERGRGGEGDGARRLESVTVRVLMPNPGDPLALPRVRADPHDGRPRERLKRTAAWYFGAMEESLRMLGDLVGEVTVRPKSVGITPTQQVYLLNGQVALTGFYHVVPRQVTIDREQVEILDLLGMDGTLLRHKPSDRPPEDRARRYVAAYVQEAQKWFEGLWGIGEPWPAPGRSGARG